MQANDAAITNSSMSAPLRRRTLTSTRPGTADTRGVSILRLHTDLLTGSETGIDRSKFETSCRGVFAIGDVRAGSVKRVASAVGEGAAVLADVHAFPDPS